MLQTGAQLYTVQLPAIFRALEASNCKYMLVEQDDCYGESPFDCLKTSYENLSKAGYR